MRYPATRRAFLQSAAGSGVLLGAGGAALLSRLPAVSAEEAALKPSMVQLTPEIEPLVRLLEETPRERLIETVAGRIQRGLTYREVLAALQLAGVRNVQPRPSVGFKFHAVLAVLSAHLASLASPEGDRWLPIFWGLDYFKVAQAQDVREGNWTMPPVDAAAMPPAERAREAFLEAMHSWNEPDADAAVAALARSAPVGAIYEQFYRLGARDFRSIGHKAIFVANSERTLEYIGKQHAEPILRSLAYALLMHEGRNPAQRDDRADRPWRRNQPIAARIPANWPQGGPDADATAALMSVLRTGSEDDASDAVADLLTRGAGPQSVWDALFCGAAELLVRQPGIVALHAVTTTNAMHYAWQVSKDDLTRRLLLLQNAAFLPMFRDAMGGRGRVDDLALDQLEPAPPTENDDEALEEIFLEVGRSPRLAVQKTLGYLRAGGDPAALAAAARRLILLKVNNSHDYKFSSAVLEDYQAVSPRWRDLYLAGNMVLMRGIRDRDNPLVDRVRQAFA